MEWVEELVQGDAVMVQPMWTPRLSLGSKQIHEMYAHPSLYHQFDKGWIEAE